MEEIRDDLLKKAYTELKNMIFNQSISQGQKLINRDLAKLLNMSSTPVQLALCKMEQEGFVERIQNRGFYVKRITMQEIEDLFDLREVIEVHAIELAIKNQTPGGMKLLHEAMMNYKNYELPVYTRKRLTLDAEFHWQIAAMSKNQELLKQLKRIYEHTYLRSPIGYIPAARLPMTAAQHVTIYEMIKDRKISSAQKYLSLHIKGAREMKVQTLLQQGTE